MKERVPGTREILPVQKRNKVKRLQFVLIVKLDFKILKKYNKIERGCY